MKSGVDLELDLGGHLIHFIVFSCKKFLSAIVCYRNIAILCGMALWPS